MEQASRYCEQLVWQRCKASRKYNPEIVFVIEVRHLLEAFDREDVVEEQEPYILPTDAARENNRSRIRIMRRGPSLQGIL